MKYGFVACLVICIAYDLPAWAIAIYWIIASGLQWASDFVDMNTEKAPAAGKQSGTRN